MKPFVILLLLLLFPLAAAAQEAPVPAAPETSSVSPAAKPGRIPASERPDTYRFVYGFDNKRTMESGVSLAWNSSLLLYRGANYLADKTGLHDHWYSRPFFLPLLSLTLPTPKQYLHEYYGHGSALREFGYTDVDYKWGWFNIPSKDGLASSILAWQTGTYEEKQLWIGGGLAASQLYLLEAEKDMYRKGRTALLMFQPVMSYMNDISYVRSGLTPDDLNKLNDGASWLTSFKAVNNNDALLTSEFADKSKKALATATLDPVIPWLAVTWLHYLWTGEDTFYAPMIPLAGLRFGLSPKVNLTPLGPENYYYLFIVRKGRLASLYFRNGSSTGAPVKGYGAEFGPINIAGVSLTPGYDNWTLPEMEHTTLEYSKSGYNAQLKLDAPLYGALGLTGKAAYKTAGYMLGLPAHKGFYGFGGLSLSF